MSKVDVILYYADWCGHCKAFKPQWEEFKRMVDNLKTKKLKTDSGVGVELTVKEYESANIPANDNTINGEPINGFPTIKVRVDNREFEYMGKRDAKELFKYTMDWVNNPGR